MLGTLSSILPLPSSAVHPLGLLSGTQTALLLCGSTRSQCLALRGRIRFPLRLPASFLVSIFAPGLPHASFLPHPQNLTLSCKAAWKTSPSGFSILIHSNADGPSPWSTSLWPILYNVPVDPLVNLLEKIFEGRDHGLATSLHVSQPALSTKTKVTGLKS